MICSHNTFTYLSPDKWWMRLLKPFSCCQNNPIDAQKEHGVVMADIRVSLHDNLWCVSHGLVTYSRLPYIIYMLRKNNIKDVRILVEGKYTDANVRMLEDTLKISYPDFKFYVGRDKDTWKKVMDFPDLEITQMVGSMQSWYGKICPWLYTFFNKKKLDEEKKKALTSEELVSFDFL